MYVRYNPVTPIGGKSPINQATMFGKVQDTGKVVTSDPESLLKELYSSIGTSLNGLLQNFSVGNILAVKTELTDNYEGLAINIRKNSKPDFLYYEVMRLLLSKVLDGMNQSIKQYMLYLDTVAKLDVCNSYKSILDDPVKLKEYIDKLNQQKYLFDVEPITAMKAILKPQYAEYVRLYGFPGDGVFNSERLADIIYKLQRDLPITAITTII